MIRTRGALLVAAVVVAVTALTGCSSSSDSPAVSSASPTVSKVGGMTKCTEAAIKPTLEAGLSKDVELMSWDELSCADGWAVVGATIGDGEHGAPTPFIFQAEGQFWIPKQQQDVCGTVDNSVNPPIYPADALIPEALFTDGCLVG